MRKGRSPRRVAKNVFPRLDEPIGERRGCVNAAIVSTLERVAANRHSESPPRAPSSPLVVLVLVVVVLERTEGRENTRNKNNKNNKNENAAHTTNGSGEETPKIGASRRLPG